MKKLLMTAGAALCLSAAFGQDPLAEALSLVPAEALLLEPASIVTWGDNAAALASRGLSAAGSFAELPADQLPAYMSAVSPGLVADLQMYLAMAGEWPVKNGFDLFEVPYQLSFGAAPYLGFALQGDFAASQVIQPLLERHAYSQAGELTDLQLLCPEAGCDTGMNLDMARRDPAFAFGGVMGRSFPVAVADGTLLYSSSDSLVRLMAEAAAGEATSLNDLTEVRAIGSRLLESGDIVALQLFNPAVAATIDPQRASDPESFTSLQETMAALPGLPPYSLLALGSTAGNGTEHALVMLAYPDAATAELARESVDARLDALDSARSGSSYREYLAGMGTLAAPAVWQHPDSDVSLVVLDLTAEIAEPDQQGAFTGQLFSRLSGMVTQRDVLWLTPGN